MTGGRLSDASGGTVDDSAEHRADNAALLERVDTETSETFEAVREIELEVLLELLLLPIRQDAVEQTLRVVGRELREFGRRKPAVDAEHGRQADAHVQIGRTAFDRHAHQFVHAQPE